MEEVKDWLCENGFGDYGQNFEDNGWDDLTLLPDMTYVQIKKCIHKEGHVAKFRKAARQLKIDSNADINDEIVMYNRKLNTRAGKRTTECPTENRKPVTTSPGSGGTEDEDGVDFDAGIINAASSEVCSST